MEQLTEQTKAQQFAVNADHIQAELDKITKVYDAKFDQYVS